MDLKNSAISAPYNNIGGANLSSPIAGQNEGLDFGGMVDDVLDSTANTISKVESVAAASLVDNASIEELATAVSNAEVTLKTVVAVRDRIINAYQEIIKMPI